MIQAISCFTCFEVIPPPRNLVKADAVNNSENLVEGADAVFEKKLDAVEGAESQGLFQAKNHLAADIVLGFLKLFFGNRV